MIGDGRITVQALNDKKNATRSPSANVRVRGGSPQIPESDQRPTQEYVIPKMDHDAFAAVAT